MFKKMLVAVMAMTVAACASPYVATPYDRASGLVDDIAVIDDSMPEKAMAYEVASVGSNFGLIGALVDAGIQAERQGAVNNALVGVGFDAEAKLESRIITALARNGYKAATLDGSARPKRDFLETYPDAPDNVDGLLDIAIINYGYMSAGAGQPFRPTVWAKVKLVRVSDGSTLMENIIIYNPLNATQGVVTLPPNPEFSFRNRTELLADPGRLAAGIEDALNQVADTAAQLLH